MVNGYHGHGAKSVICSFLFLTGGHRVVYWQLVPESEHVPKICSTRLDRQIVNGIGNKIDRRNRSKLIDRRNRSSVLLTALDGAQPPGRTAGARRPHREHRPFGRRQLGYAISLQPIFCDVLRLTSRFQLMQEGQRKVGTSAIAGHS